MDKRVNKWKTSIFIIIFISFFINPASSQTAEEWVEKGIELDNLGKYEEAIKSYDKALEINPKDAKAWIAKGAALGKLGRHEDAIAAFDKALEINPKDAMAWVAKGDALGLRPISRQ